ncbi:MAG TPA: MarR family transcriptional regulator [Kofleriaceae bacterium]|jgi:DNA-binding MarR family transcriptional regulator|nr:MarR family transcriptional regulator [Kofleriaceae bacterium]
MQDDRLEASLSHALVRLFRLQNRLYSRALREVGLSAEQAHLLSVLWERGAMTMGALQKQLALSSATLTGAIDRMEADGLVRRVPSPDDKRAFVLEARTSAKRRAQIEAAIDAGEVRCFRALGKRDRGELLRLLAACATDLEPDAAAR